MFVYKTNSDFSHTRSSVPKENLNFHKWKIYFPSSLLATEMKNRNFQLRYSVFNLNARRVRRVCRVRRVNCYVPLHAESADACQIR